MGQTVQKYNLLYVDPPWPYNQRAAWSDSRFGGGVSQAYPVMTDQDLFRMKEVIDPIVAKDCLLLLWAVWPKMDVAIDLIRAWDFKFSTRAFTWLKTYPKSGKLFQGPGASTACLVGDTLVCVYDTQRNFVENVTLSYLYQGGNWRRYKIWSPTGWKRIHNMVRNEGTQCHRYTTQFGDLMCSTNHKLFFKDVKREHIRYEGGHRIRKFRHFVCCAESTDIKNNYETRHDAGVSLLFSQTPISSPNPLAEIDGIALTYDVGWLIGLYCADGSTSVATSRVRPDWQVKFSLGIEKKGSYRGRIEAIVDNLGLHQDRYLNTPVNVRTHVCSDRGVYYTYFSSKKLVQFIKKIVLGDDAHTKRLNIPLLLQTPVEFRNGLFDGIYAGDGLHGYALCGRKIQNNSRNRIILCNEQLIHDIRKLCHTIGMPTSERFANHEVTKIFPGGNTYTSSASYSMRVTHGICPQLLSVSGASTETIRIYEISKPTVPVSTYDLSVEDEVFIANNIVSHNSNEEVIISAYRGQFPAPDLKLQSGIYEDEIFGVDDDPCVKLPHPRYPKDYCDQTKRNKIIHSAKPEEFSARIERLWPKHRKLEMFARRVRPGWDCVGLDLSGLDIYEELTQIRHGTWTQSWPYSQGELSIGSRFGVQAASSLLARISMDRSFGLRVLETL